MQTAFIQLRKPSTTRFRYLIKFIECGFPNQLVKFVNFCCHQPDIFYFVIFYFPHLSSKSLYRLMCVCRFVSRQYWMYMWGVESEVLHFSSVQICPLVFSLNFFSLDLGFADLLEQLANDFEEFTYLRLHCARIP